MSIKLDTIFSAVSNYKTTTEKLSGTNAKEIKQMFASDRSDGTSFLKTKTLKELMDFKGGLVNLKIKNPGSAEGINDVIEKVNDVAGDLINKKYERPETVRISQEAANKAGSLKGAKRKTTRKPKRIPRAETLPHSSVTPAPKPKSKTNPYTPRTSPNLGERSAELTQNNLNWARTEVINRGYSTSSKTYAKMDKLITMMPAEDFIKWVNNLAFSA